VATALNVQGLTGERGAGWRLECRNRPPKTFLASPRPAHVREARDTRKALGSVLNERAFLECRPRHVRTHHPMGSIFILFKILNHAPNLNVKVDPQRRRLAAASPTLLFKLCQKAARRKRNMSDLLLIQYTGRGRPKSTPPLKRIHNPPLT
jgi:hypothetical protein